MKTTDIDYSKPDTGDVVVLDGEFDDWPDVYSKEDIEKTEKGGTENADSETEIRRNGK
jgi:hypothetical protein